MHINNVEKEKACSILNGRRQDLDAHLIEIVPSSLWVPDWSFKQATHNFFWRRSSASIPSLMPQHSIPRGKKHGESLLGHSGWGIPFIFKIYAFFLHPKEYSETITIFVVVPLFCPTIKANETFSFARGWSGNSYPPIIYRDGPKLPPPQELNIKTKHDPELSLFSLFFDCY